MKKSKYCIKIFANFNYYLRPNYKFEGFIRWGGSHTADAKNCFLKLKETPNGPRRPPSGKERCLPPSHTNFQSWNSTGKVISLLWSSCIHWAPKHSPLFIFLKRHSHSCCGPRETWTGLEEPGHDFINPECVVWTFYVRHHIWKNVPTEYIIIHAVVLNKLILQTFLLS